MGRVSGEETDRLFRYVTGALLINLRLSAVRYGPLPVVIGHIALLNSPSVGPALPRAWRTWSALIRFARIVLQICRTIASLCPNAPIDSHSAPRRL